MKGAGTILHEMIVRWTGEVPRHGCGCRDLIKKMDALGPDWCEKHKLDIVAHILKEARDRAKQWKAIPVNEDGSPVSETIMKSWLRTAKGCLWRGAYWIPGANMFLRQMVEKMVSDAIKQARDAH